MAANCEVCNSFDEELNKCSLFFFKVPCRNFERLSGATDQEGLIR